MIALALFAAMLFAGQPALAAGPVYTDQDLEQYGARHGQSPDATDSGAGEQISRTSQTPKSKDEIFRENEHSIAAVVAYDEKGTSFSHGSGFMISANGACADQLPHHQQCGLCQGKSR